MLYIIKQYIHYALLTLSIPFIFLYTKKNSIDRFIGELSYPVYITHWFVLYYMIPAFNHIFSLSKDFSAQKAVIFSIVFSYLIIKLFIDRIDAYREKRLSLFKSQQA